MLVSQTNSSVKFWRLLNRDALFFLLIAASSGNISSAMNLDERRQAFSGVSLLPPAPHASSSSGFLTTYQGVGYPIGGSRSYGRDMESQRVARASENEWRGTVCLATFMVCFLVGAALSYMRIQEGKNFDLISYSFGCFYNGC